jgi:trigger factor
VKSTTEKLSPTRVRLSVEVPFDELRTSVEAAYKKIGAQIRVPGFRPGKVPARIIDQRVGRAAVLQEAVNEIVPRKYVEAAREHELKALGQPEIDVTSLADNESLSFTADVDVRPDIRLPDLDGIEVTVDDVTVTEADVDEQLDALRERFGSLTGVDRPAQDGDYVSLDLVASIDGEHVDAGSASGMSYQVGSHDLIDGLDDAIRGGRAGETATFTATLQHGAHAGEDAEISATVNSVKERELPPLDDDFAQLASEFDTVDQLRADLRERLTRAKSLGQAAQARDAVLERLVTSVDFPVPDAALKAEVEYREHEVTHTLGHDDALFGRYLSAQGKTREEFDAELRQSAERSVRAQFVLDALAEVTDVQVGDAELTEYLVRQSARYDMAPQEFANQVMQSGNLPAMVADVRRNKALADLLESTVVRDSSGGRVDLSALSPTALADIADGGDDEEDDELG